MTKRGCAMTCRRRAGCLLRVHHPPRRHPRPRTPTLFPLSRECMRPKLYLSTVESPSLAFLLFLSYASCACAPGASDCSVSLHVENGCEAVNVACLRDICLTSAARPASAEADA